MDKRKNLRLEAYDYSENGCYFVTLCAKGKRRLFAKGLVGDGVLDVPQVQLSDYGRRIDDRIRAMMATYDHISVMNYVIMPNHVHFLLLVQMPPAAAGPSGTPAPTNAVIPRWISTLK